MLDDFMFDHLLLTKAITTIGLIFIINIKRTNRLSPNVSRKYDLQNTRSLNFTNI